MVEVAIADALGLATSALLHEPERCAIARLRSFSTAALITTRFRFQARNAWSTSARTAAVIVPRPCSPAASQ